jgi:hypothetical protein
MGRDYAGWGVLPKFADGHGHFMKADCAASYHVALLTPAILLNLGLSPAVMVLNRVPGQRS